MFTARDHFSTASQSALQNQLDLNTQLSSTLLKSTEKFMQLQTSFARGALQDTQDTVYQVLSMDTPQNLAASPLIQVQPFSRRAAAYGCQAASVMVQTQAELAELFSAQVQETSNEASALFADIGKNLPDGLNVLAHSMQTLLQQANVSSEQFRQASKHVLNLLEANLNVAANQFGRATAQGMPSSGAAA